MKKLLIFFLLVLSANIFAQYPLRNGEKQLNAGFGFSSWGLPIYGGIDFGVHKDVSVGGEISFRSYNEGWAGSDYSHTVVGISGNANYHFNYLLQIPSEWDVYAGLNLGFYIWNSPGGYKGSNSSGLGLGIQVGGRYYFSPRWAGNLEFGGGNAFAGGKIGITYKL